MIFMIPKSAVLCLYAPWSSALRFVELASVTDIIYYPVLDFDRRKMKKKCKNVFSMTDLSLLKPEPCQGQGHMEKFVSINPLSIIYSLQHLEVVVKSVKYNM